MRCPHFPWEVLELLLNASEDVLGTRGTPWTLQGSFWDISRPFWMNPRTPWINMRTPQTRQILSGTSPDLLDDSRITQTLMRTLWTVPDSTGTIFRSAQGLLSAPGHIVGAHRSFQGPTGSTWGRPGHPKPTWDISRLFWLSPEPPGCTQTSLGLLLQILLHDSKGG